LVEKSPQLASILAHAAPQSTASGEPAMKRRASYTERRRARLALKVDVLDRLESRSTITEPISVAGLRA
jgi:hypothetical protein